MAELGNGVTVVVLPSTAVGPGTVVPVPGPPGAPGAPGGSLVHVQPDPVAVWTITHPLGRLPAVALYVAGELVDADVDAGAAAVTVTFPTPTAGTAVLT